MAEAVLSAKGIEKTFPGVHALKNVDFDVRAGEVHALCGENGAGKSTLMHILAGVYKQDAGEIYMNGEPINIHNQRDANQQGIAIVYQERSLVGGLCVAENVFAARQPAKRLSWIDWKRLYRETGDILRSLGINIDPKAMVSSLSPAMQQMVEIAKALSIKPKVLILDEPTATITEKEVVALFGARVDSADVVDVDNKWLVSNMVGRDIEFRREQRTISGEVVLEVKDFNSSLFKNVSFNLRRGEIVGFAGLSGAGRTEVMRAVFGADKKHSGEVYVRQDRREVKSTRHAIDLGLGYLPEDRKAQGLFLEMSVARNIVSASLKKISSGPVINDHQLLDEAEIYKERLNIMTPSVKQKVINLSGGNQQKVVFAKWMMVNPDIMIVDEPTRGVDVGAKAEIYGILREMTQGGASIIVVSSDLPEILSISDRIYVMHEGRVTGMVNGGEATEEMIIRYASGIVDA